MRGYAAVALDNPKDAVNVGGTLRAAGVYGAKLVVLGGHRRLVAVRHAADTMKAYRHIPVIRTDDIFDAVPFDCTPVAVDIIDGAIPLPAFRHPERAFYIFGPEDSTLGARVTERCAHTVVVPTDRCMNLAATVNVILYDRLAKQARAA